MMFNADQEPETGRCLQANPDLPPCPNQVPAKPGNRRMLLQKLPEYTRHVAFPSANDWFARQRPLRALLDAWHIFLFFYLLTVIRACALNKDNEGNHRNRQHAMAIKARYCNITLTSRFKRTALPHWSARHDAGEDEHGIRCQYRAR